MLLGCCPFLFKAVETYLSKKALQCIKSVLLTYVSSLYNFADFGTVEILEVLLPAVQSSLWTVHCMSKHLSYMSSAQVEIDAASNKPLPKKSAMTPKPFGLLFSCAKNLSCSVAPIRIARFMSSMFLN